MLLYIFFLDVSYCWGETKVEKKNIVCKKNISQATILLIKVAVGLANKKNVEATIMS